MTKTLEDVKADMSEIIDQLKSGDIEMKRASEIINATGKLLKAQQLVHLPEQLELSREQLRLARDAFEAKLSVRPVGQIEHG